MVLAGARAVARWPGRRLRPARKAHPALLVEGLNQLRARLASAGVPIAEAEEIPGVRRFYVADPFGNRIELMEIVEQEG